MSNRTVIVEDCDKCCFNQLGSGYKNEITVCIMEKLADTSRCTYGLIPQNCPLRQGDIIIRLSKKAEVMPKPQEPK